MRTSSLELTKADVEFRVARDGRALWDAVSEPWSGRLETEGRQENYKVGWVKVHTVLRAGIRTHGK